MKNLIKAIKMQIVPSWLMIVILVMITCICCDSNEASGQSIDCDTEYKQIKSLMEKYEIDSVASVIPVVSNKIDSIFNQCENYRSALIDLKVLTSVVQKNYAMGITFLDTLKTVYFSKPYKKYMYIHTLSALQYESKGDSIMKEKSYRESSMACKQYLNQNPNDKEAIYDFLYAEAQYESADYIEEVIDSLHNLSKNRKDDDFFEALKSTIMELMEKKQ